MKSWMVTLAAVLACAFLAYRVVTLEGRIDGLVAELEQGEEVSPSAAPENDGRIEALQQDLRRLREELALVERQTRRKADPEDLDQTVSEDRILSVVTNEAERIRDRHLEFQRDRWLEHREQAIDDFVQRHEIAPEQEQRLRELITVEVDSLTELLRTSEALHNPEQVASDWAAILRDTDRQVTSLLTPEQLVQWQQARLLERKLLWPWLPEE